MTQMREKLADAKHQLDATWMEIDQMIAKVDALQESLNRSHRCWPSRLGWGLAGGLATYLIFMHSFHVIQHQKEWQLHEVVSQERHANEAQERIMDRKSRAPWDGKIRF